MYIICSQVELLENPKEASDEVLKKRPRFCLTPCRRISVDTSEKLLIQLLQTPLVRCLGNDRLINEFPVYVSTITSANLKIQMLGKCLL